MTLWDISHYCGMVAGIFLFGAVLTGLRMRRWGMRPHRICAWLAAGFALAHVLLKWLA